MIHDFNWTLLSERSSQVAQYRMDCITQYAEEMEVTLIHNNTTVTNRIDQEYINSTTKILNSSVVLSNSFQNQEIECKAAKLRSDILIITGSFILSITMYKICPVHFFSSQWSSSGCGCIYQLLIQYHSQLVTSSGRS